MEHTQEQILEEAPKIQDDDGYLDLSDKVLPEEESIWDFVGIKPATPADFGFEDSWSLF